MGEPDRRFHALDAVRSGAMLLGLFFHGAISFMEMPVSWAVRDRSTHIAADLFVWICHTFRMPVFFLLSGFFARLIVERDGVAGFVRHRARRVLVPLLVAIVAVGVPMYPLYVWGRSVSAPYAGSAWERYPLQRVPEDPAELRRDPPPGHLWFLYYLVLFAALTALFCVAARRMRADAVGRGIDRLFGALVRSPLLPFVMAVPTAATLLYVRGLESETPITYVPQPHILAYYAVFFGFGWLLHRQSALVPDLRRHAWCGIAAVALLPLLLSFVAELGRTGTLPPAKRLAALYGVGLFTWLAGMSILAVATRWLARPRPWVRWLADSSYWCYLVHLPVLFFLHIVVSGLAWPGALKYAAVMAVTLAACLASYRAFVRYTFIGTWLNGRRTREAALPSADSSG